MDHFKLLVCFVEYQHSRTIVYVKFFLAVGSSTKLFFCAKQPKNIVPVQDWISPWRFFLCLLLHNISCLRMRFLFVDFELWFIVYTFACFLIYCYNFMLELYLHLRTCVCMVFSWFPTGIWNQRISNYKSVCSRKATGWLPRSQRCQTNCWICTSTGLLEFASVILKPLPPPPPTTHTHKGTS